MGLLRFKGLLDYTKGGWSFHFVLFPPFPTGGWGGGERCYD